MKNGARGIEDVGPAMRVPAGLATFAAFETALGMIPQPTFVIGDDGRILHANALGEQLLGRENASVRRALVAAARGESQAGAWRLTALQGTRSIPGFIAVLEPSPSPALESTGLQPIVSRWKLTARQAQVLDLVARGTTNATIAETLGIKERTVEFHLSAIFDKAGVDNRATLIARLLAL
jgi:DNA-binding CsgD family transcriptional regulator